MVASPARPRGSGFRSLKETVIYLHLALSLMIDGVCTTGPPGIAIRASRAHREKLKHEPYEDALASWLCRLGAWLRALLSAPPLSARVLAVVLSAPMSYVREGRAWSSRLVVTRVRSLMAPG